MKNPKWLSLKTVLALHNETLALDGGIPGIRDQGSLEMVLNRPKNKNHYNPKTPVFELTASYCFGIAQNHPFLDGNKRTAALCADAFLFLNGYEFSPDPIEYLNGILTTAQGKTKEATLTKWYKNNSPKREFS